MKTASRNFVLLLIATILTGAGCTTATVPDENAQQVAESITFDKGDTFTIRETVFGIGGQVVTLLGGEGFERAITLEDFSATKTSLTWQGQHQVETDASRQSFTDYEQAVSSTPIGQPLPSKPEREYETRTRAGSIETSGLADANALWLPAFWPEGSAITDTSVLWLSRKQYDELVNTRETRVSLGLFDEQLASIQTLKQRANDILEAARNFSLDQIGESLTQEDTDVSQVTDVQATGDWTTYDLQVNGESVHVRAIRAQNAFARYTILANENNPLVLEVIVTPASRGSLNLFGKDELRESFVGYEVVSVTQNATSSEDQHQP